jgi:hypothetical protein
LRSCGRPWSYRTTFSKIPRSRDEKSSTIVSKWRLWSTFRVALASFWLHFAGSAVTWHALFALFAKSSATLCGKAVFSYIDTTECYVLNVPARKLEPFGQRSHARQVQSGLEVVSQRGQDSQVLLVGAVLLSKLWKRPQITRKPHQVKGQSLYSRQDIWLDLLYIIYPPPCR